MQLKTILNRVEKHKSFVYGEVKLLEEGDELSLEVQIEARANGRPLCSGCEQAAPGYDRLQERRFAFVPLWGIAVYLVYGLRRVACPRCGVKAQSVAMAVAWGLAHRDLAGIKAIGVDEIQWRRGHK